MSTENKSEIFQWFLKRCGDFPEHRTIQLSGVSMTVGRTKSSSCALQSVLISRVHARFTFRNGSWFIVDNNSLNGIYINDTKIKVDTDVMLHDGDRIGFGLPTYKITERNGFIYEVKKMVQSVPRFHQENVNIKKEVIVPNIDPSIESSHVKLENQFCSNVKKEIEDTNTTIPLDQIKQENQYYPDNNVVNPKEQMTDNCDDVIIIDDEINEFEMPEVNHKKDEISSEIKGTNALSLINVIEEGDFDELEKSIFSIENDRTVDNIAVPSDTGSDIVQCDDNETTSKLNYKNRICNSTMTFKHLRVCVEDCIKSPRFRLPPNVVWKRKHERNSKNDCIDVSSSDEEEIIISKKSKFNSNEKKNSEIPSSFLPNNIISDSDSDDGLLNSSYSQNDIITISDEEDDFFTNKSEKEVKIKKEVMDEWYEEEDNWRDFSADAEVETRSESNFNLPSCSYSESINKKWEEQHELATKVSSIAWAETEQQFVKSIDKESENIENITMFLAESNEKQKDDDDFFPELSQNFYENDSESSDSSNSINKYENKNKSKSFYGAKFTPAQPLPLQGRQKKMLEKFDTVPKKHENPNYERLKWTKDSVTAHSIRNKGKSSVDKLKDRVSKKMGYRIPIPGGGSAVRPKGAVDSPKKPEPKKVKTSFNKQSTSNTSSIKAKTDEVKNKRTEKSIIKSSSKETNRKKSDGRFMSRSKFLTEMSTKLPPAFSQSRKLKNSSVPSLLHSGYKIPKKTQQENIPANRKKAVIETEKQPQEKEALTKDQEKGTSICKNQQQEKQISFPVNLPVLTKDRPENLTSVPNTPKSIMGGLSSKGSSRVLSQEAPKKVQFSDINETFVIPRNINRPHKNDISYQTPKIIPTTIWQVEDFINHIIHWRPAWLHEQEINPEPPPIVNYKRIFPTLLSYENIDDYQRIFKPLLLMETWAKISSDLKEVSFCLPGIVITGCSIDPGISNKNLITSYNCYTLINEQSLKAGHQPVDGHLTVLTLVLNEEHNKGATNVAIFGLVVQVQKRRHQPNVIEDKFSPIAKHPLVNGLNVWRYDFTLKCKCKFNYNPHVLMSMKVLSYIKPCLRQFQALIQLPNSLLAADILKPRKKVCESSFNPHVPLLSQEHNMNISQKTSVVRLCESCSNGNIPKIGLLQGPPGTGKSHTIIALVQQILFCKDMKIRSGLEPKILLTAPSNNAVDDLVARLIQVRSRLRDKRQLKLVRVGNNSSINPQVLEFSLDYLVKTNMKEKMKEKVPPSVGNELKYIDKQEQELHRQMNDLHITSDYMQINKLQDKLKEFANKKKTLLKSREYVMNAQSPDYYRMEQQMKTDLLRNANIIVTTLSSCRQRAMETAFSQSRGCFSVCIIDEATQCIEPDILLPLMFGMSKIILVGDPEQLPPTVLSQKAQELGLGQSLFERLYKLFQDESEVILFLDIQYRMHPEICRFPSQWFYNGGLKTYQLLEARYRSCPFIPYCLFNLYNSKEDGDENGEKYNKYELEFILELLSFISSKNSQNLSIGVITPYQGQKIRLKNEVRRRSLSHHWIEVNTVDGFQGRESDIIILGCVRANNLSSIGFLSDRKRLNVALTRAKQSLFLCGHFQSLKSNDDWLALYEDAKIRNCVVDVPSETVIKNIIPKILKK